MRMFGTTQVRVPMAARRGVTTMHACVMDGLLVYRAQDGATPGLYREDPVGDSQPLLMDDPRTMHMFPVPVGNALLIHAVKPGSLPPAPSEILYWRRGRVEARVPGSAVGVSED